MNIHGGVRFSCTFDACFQSYPTVKSLKRHEREFHGPKDDSALCPDTPSESEWEGNNDGNKEGVKKEDNPDGGDSNDETYLDGSTTFKTYSCSSCDKSFKKHWQLKTHSYDHTGILPFKCKENDCERSFLYRSHLRRHVKQSHRLHRCQLHPQCEAIFKSSLEAKKHFQLAHKRKSCPECGKSVKSDRMKAHLATHSEVRKVFRCPRKDCERQFLAKKNLVAHLRINHGAPSTGVVDITQLCGVNDITELCGVNPSVDNENDERSDKIDGPKPSICAQNNNNNNNNIADGPIRLPCPISGCDVKFVSKTTRDRHVKNLHEKKDRGEEEEEEVPKKRRKSKPRTDFAKELTGFYRSVSGRVEIEGEQGDERDDEEEEEEEEDEFVLKSLNLPTRHDDI